MGKSIVGLDSPHQKCIFPKHTDCINEEGDKSHQDLPTDHALTGISNSSQYILYPPCHISEQSYSSRVNPKFGPLSLIILTWIKEEPFILQQALSNVTCLPSMSE